jgi:hypothetical protein
MPHFIVLLLTVVLLGPSAALAGAAEPAVWNQERVSALATELAIAVKGVRKSARQHLPLPTHIASGGAARYRLLNVLRAFERQTAFLAAELQAGRGRDETQPVFEWIERLRRRAEEDMRRLDVPNPARDQIAAARIVLQQLNTYYASEGVPPPERSE